MSCGRKIGPFDCCSVVQGDCLELMKQLPDGCVDAVITDPPYPKLDYGWIPADPRLFARLATHQLWFWMNMEPFPLPTTAFHVWAKSNVYIGDSELFEVIHEVGGNRICSVLSYPAINSEVAANMAQEVFYSHPCQKPLRLMEKLIEKTTGTVIDPYTGTGTTLIAAARLHRHYLGFEISREHYLTAHTRLADLEAQPALFTPVAQQMKFSERT